MTTNDPFNGPPMEQPQYPPPAPQYPPPAPAAPHQPLQFPPPQQTPYQPLPGGLPSPPPYAAPVPKRSRRWMWFIAVPLVLLLAIGGCTALIVRSVQGPLDAVNTFVAKLDEGDLQGAYDSLCQQARGAVTAEEWTADIERALGDDVTAYRFTETAISTDNGRSTATVSGTIEVDGESRSVSYGLVEEGSQWRVCTAQS